MVVLFTIVIVICDVVIVAIAHNISFTAPIITWIVAVVLILSLLQSTYVLHRWNPRFIYSLNYLISMKVLS